MPDPISLSNRALFQAGARETIASFNEGSVSAQTCDVLFQPTYETLARMAFWNCFRAQCNLTLLKAAQSTPENQAGTFPYPPQPWLYEYLIPPDCLKVRYLLPTASVTALPVPIFPVASGVTSTVAPKQMIDFVVSTDKDAQGNRQKVILTNLSQAQVVYTVDEPNPEFWDSQFQSAFVSSLAASLIPPLNLNLGLLNIQMKIANDIIEAARTSDGNEGVNDQTREAEWITARGYGCGFLSNDTNWPSSKI